MPRAFSSDGECPRGSAPPLPGLWTRCFGTLRGTPSSQPRLTGSGRLREELRCAWGHRGTGEGMERSSEEVSSSCDRRSLWIPPERFASCFTGQPARRPARAIAGVYLPLSNTALACTVTHTLSTKPQSPPFTQICTHRYDQPQPIILPSLSLKKTRNQTQICALKKK